MVHCAGIPSGKLISYRIDSSTGALERVTVTEVGASPMWCIVASVKGQAQRL